MKVSGTFIPNTSIPETKTCEPFGKLAAQLGNERVATTTAL